MIIMDVHSCYEFDGLNMQGKVYHDQFVIGRHITDLDYVIGFNCYSHHSITYLM